MQVRNALKKIGNHRSIDAHSILFQKYDYHLQANSDQPFTPPLTADSWVVVKPKYTVHCLQKSNFKPGSSLNNAGDRVRLKAL